LDLQINLDVENAKEYRLSISVLQILAVEIIVWMKF